MADLNTLFAPLSLTRSVDPNIDQTELEVTSLYRAHRPGLLRYAMTIVPDWLLAEDALQEVFLRFFLTLREGKDVENAQAWLYKALRNLLLDECRRVSVRLCHALGSASEQLDRRQDTAARLEQAQIAESIKTSLTPRELECLSLRIEGLAYREIAEVLHIRSGTVGALLARAVRKARLLLRQRRGERE